MLFRASRGLRQLRVPSAETPPHCCGQEGHCGVAGVPSCRGGMAGAAGDAVLALGSLVISRQHGAAGLKDFWGSQPPCFGFGLTSFPVHQLLEFSEVTCGCCCCISTCLVLPALCGSCCCSSPLSWLGKLRLENSSIYPPCLSLPAREEPSLLGQIQPSCHREQVCDSPAGHHLHGCFLCGFGQVLV